MEEAGKGLQPQRKSRGQRGGEDTGREGGNGGCEGEAGDRNLPCLRRR